MARAKKTSLDKLYARRFQLWSELVNLGDFVRGSVVLLRRPCTRERCLQCQSGQKHPATYLSVSQQGRTKLLYLSRAVQPQARRWVANYRRLMELIESVSEVNRDILRQVDQEGRRGGRGGRR